MANGVKTLTGLVPGEYTVVESKAGVDGYTVETTYSVTDNENITVEGGKTTEVEVTNTYTLIKGSLKVTKTFAGDELTAIQKAGISFVVTGPDGYEAEFTYAQMTDGEMILEDLVPGEYTVVESNADVEGYTVTTTYSVEDGKATVVAEETAEVDVTNTYTRKTGDLTVTKTVEPEEGTVIDPDQEFEFTVRLSDGSINGIYGDMNFVNGVATVVLKHGESATATGLPEGIMYTVTETPVTGYELKDSTGASGSIVDGTVAEAQFVNGRLRDEYHANGSVQIEAEKVLVGAALADGQFSFELKDADNNFLQARVNDADGKITFDPIEYTEEDTGKTFVYTVSEVIGDADGIIYDDTVYEVTVTVTDNGDGTLNVEQSVVNLATEGNADAITFTNEFIPDQPYVGMTTGFDARKVYLVNHKVQALAGGEFEFKLVEVDADGNELDDAYVETVKNDADGNISFGEIMYSEPGTHYYQVSEIDGGVANISYDKTVYTIKVEISANADNDLVITKTVSNVDETSAEVVFTNRGITTTSGSDEDQAYRGPSADVEQPYIGEDEEFESEDSEESEEEYDEEDGPKAKAKATAKAKTKKVNTVKSVKAVSTIKTVKTGDTANTTVWIFTLLAATCVVITSERVRRRKRNELND